MKSLGSVASACFTNLPAFCGFLLDIQQDNFPMLDSYVVIVVRVRLIPCCFSIDSITD